MRKNKIGLVLEGGGMRGLYTTGVLDAFIEANIEFDGVIGVSAGACHAASYLAKQMGRGERVNVNYLDNKNYAGLRSLVTTGDYFGADFIYRQIPDELDPFDYATYNQRKAWFRAVVTNIKTGLPEYPLIDQMERDVVYIRASSSLPLLSKNVEINGKEYLDGGVSDSIPVEASMSFGCKKNIIVLTQYPAYRKKPSPILPLIKAKYRHYPKLVEAMENRHLLYNQTLDKIEALKQQGSVLVIQPQEPVTIDRLEKDPEKLKTLYALGLEDGREQIEAIRKFMQQ